MQVHACTDTHRQHIQNSGALYVTWALPCRVSEVLNLHFRVSCMACVVSLEQVCQHIGTVQSSWPCSVSWIKNYNDFLPDMKGWRSQLNGVECFFSFSFSCNHGKTRRVKNVNIELPHSMWYDRFEISAAAVHFFKHQSLSKHCLNESQTTLI